MKNIVSNMRLLQYICGVCSLAFYANMYADQIQNDPIERYQTDDVKNDAKWPLNTDIQPDPNTMINVVYNRYEEVDGGEIDLDVVTPLLPDWLCRASLDNAPEVLRGMFAYLSMHTENQIIPAAHRIILVGSPGAGKTTLAQAFAQSLGYEVTFISAASLLGRHRNHTAINIRSLFDRFQAPSCKRALIIDELHKLFEHYESEHTDTYDNAMAFWTELDQLERRNNNIIVIGTANRVDILPPEIKSRFYGKIIEMPLPDPQQKFKALRDLIQHDDSIQVTISDAFLHAMSLQIKSYSMRDVQTLIDTAKIFFYAETIGGSDKFYRDLQAGSSNSGPIVLQEHHFKRALKYLKNDPAAKTWYTHMRPKIKEWSEVIGVVAQTIFVSSVCITLAQQGYTKIPSLLDIL